MEHRAGRKLQAASYKSQVTSRRNEMGNGIVHSAWSMAKEATRNVNRETRKCNGMGQSAWSIVKEATRNGKSGDKLKDRKS
jgi:hypothetical protein